MKLSVLSGRTLKEMIRDPINMVFGLGFPLAILLLLTAIQANIPVDLFALDSITPGIVVFGLSFISLFSAVLISKDRAGSFMLRLFTSPLKSADYIFAYALPLIPMAICQMIVCFAAAFCLGYRGDIVNVLMCLAVELPAVLFFIGIGLLCGSIFNDKQVGGICGALLTNLTAWLSGTWFDLDMVGGTFKAVAEIFPFCHAVDAGRAALAGDFTGMLPDMLFVLAWAAVILIAAVVVFTRKMRAE